MSLSNSNLKWILIVIGPMCVMIIYLLYQKNSLEILYNSTNIASRFPWVRDSSNVNPQTLQKELVFIGHSSVKVNSNMDQDETDIALFNFMSKRHFACENSMRFGNILDGGWDMCLAGPYLPKQPCLVYSFGISYDFTFDDAIAKKFNCTVRSFDPSMKDADHQRSANVWFYKTGIGGKNFVNDKQWTLKTLSTLIASFHETDKVIDYLKMDVEESEWASLVPMLADGTLSKVKQFGIELHFPKTDASTLYSHYQLLNQLEEAGFRRWYFAQNYYHIKKTKNGFRSCCYEMVYINTKFLGTDYNWGNV